MRLSQLAVRNIAHAEMADRGPEIALLREQVISAPQKERRVERVLPESALGSKCCARGVAGTWINR